MQTVLPPCINESVREKAHKELDRLFDETDGVRGWFGEIGIKIPVANGQYQRSLKTIQEQNHKL